MKSRYTFLAVLTFLFLCNFAQQTLSEFFERTDSFLSKNVLQGGVKYENIIQNKEELNGLISFIKEFDHEKSEYQKAYLINVYNLLVIHQVVENWPVASPQQISGFFEQKNFTVGGKKESLNILENEILRKKYKDPRFHFVLVCAGKGCPPITSFAYVPNKLEEQMERQAKKALNNEGFIRQDSEDKTIYLSEIFNWYSEDFGGNNSSTIEYINGYRESKFNADYKVRYAPYDWSINKYSGVDNGNKDSRVSITGNADEPVVGGQTFNPGSLLKKGQYDLTMFNTLYTQTKSNWLGVDYSGNRETFVTHLMQATFGVSNNNRVNLGIDLNLRSSGFSEDSTAAGLANAFRYKNDSISRYGLTAVGLRVKFQPFEGVNSFSIQSTLQIPTVKSPEGGVVEENGVSKRLYWADWDRFTWWNQLFYTKTFGDFQLFAEFDMLFRFRRYQEQIGMLDMPMSVFFSYFPTKKITLYAMSQHVPRLTNNINRSATDWVIPMNYTASGMGMKYQFSPRFNIELLYSNFWAGKNTGLGSTFNIGLKYISF